VIRSGAPDGTGADWRLRGRRWIAAAYRLDRGGGRCFFAVLTYQGEEIRFGYELDGDTFTLTGGKKLPLDGVGMVDIAVEFKRPNRKRGPA
jgi:hypothetical protein